jgi:outer membrane autotransporter protein
MAAPHVTGAVAIGAEIFPNASGAQLTQLVLQTATDIGEKGIDAIYGWGLLNIGNMVATINPATAGTFANAAWSRTSAFTPINTVLRQQLGRTAPTPTGSQEFPALGYAPTNLVSMPESVRLSQSPGPQVWVAPVYGTASIAAGPTSYGADSNTGGLLAGIDILHDKNAQFGLALGYSHTALKTQTGGDSADTNAFHLGAYGAWQQDGWFINGTGQAALFSQSIERKAISGAQGLSFDPVGRTTLPGSGLGMSLQAGHEITLSNGASVSPYLAAAATWQGTGAASESGAGVFNLTLPAANHAQFEAGPGVRFASAPILLEDNTLRLTLDMSYARIGGTTDNAITVDLLGREITGRSVELGRDVLRVGGTIDLTTGAGHNWFATYDGSFRQGAAAHSVSAGFKVSL